MNARNISNAWFAIGVFILVVMLCAIWYLLPGLGVFIQNHPAFYPAAFVGSGFLMLSLAGELWLESTYLRRSWLQRAAAQADLAELKPGSPLRKLADKLPDPFNWIWKPLWTSGIGRAMEKTWLAGNLPWKPSLYPSAVLLLTASAFMIGSRIAGPLLGVAAAIAAVWLLARVVSGRANRVYREVDEQLPNAIDSLASGMASGQSFQQALHSTSDELSGSLGLVLCKLSTRIKMGIPAHEALQSLIGEHTQEGLALTLEGIILQRQFGGDMVRMLDDVAALLRSRLELEREVRAITAQGRLSGAIVAGLVPVSAGFLLMFNPGYLDILFETLIGQVLIVLTFSFQVAGWYVISRLVRVRY